MNFHSLSLIGIGIISFSILFFILIMQFQRQTLWSGFSFLCALFALAIFAFFLVTYFSEEIQEQPVLYFSILFFGVIAALLLVFMPLIILLVFFCEGIKLIRKEGFHWQNMLSIGFAVLLIILLRHPNFGFSKEASIGNVLYTALLLGVFYALFLLTMYVVSNLMNLWHIRENHHFDYIVVLGSGIFGTRVPPLLANRIERGMRLAEKNPNAVLILSGGQGQGESIPEGKAMASYAIEHGFDPVRIIIEDQSRNTWENLSFSRRKMEKKKPRIAIVTTSFHVFRALMIAHRQKMTCIGYGAKTKWYFTLNAIIREFIGYLSLTWKRHTCMYVMLLFLYFGFRMLIQYVQTRW